MIKKTLPLLILASTLALSPASAQGNDEQPDKTTRSLVNETTSTNILVPSLLKKLNAERFNAKIVITTPEGVEIFELKEKVMLFSALRDNGVNPVILRQEDGKRLVNKWIENQENLFFNEISFEGSTSKEILEIPQTKIASPFLPKGINKEKQKGATGLTLKTSVKQVDKDGRAKKSSIETFSIINAPVPQITYVGVGAEDPFSVTCENGTTVPADVNPNLAIVHNATCFLYPDISVFGTWRRGAGTQDHGTGTAVDIMVKDETGTELAELLKAHPEAFGIKYIIWRQHIWSTERADEGWRLMEDRGGDTANHMDHVHVSVLPQPASSL